MKNIKLIRVATVPISLRVLLKGQLEYLNKYYEVIAVSSNSKELKQIEIEEGVKTFPLEMQRDISLLNDLIALFRMYFFLRREKPYIVHSHTPKAGLITMIAAFWAGIPNRWYTVTGLRFETLKGIKKNIVIFTYKLTCLFATKIIPEGLGVKNTLIKNRVTKKNLQVIGNGNINGINTEYYSRNKLSNEELIIIKEKVNIKDDFVFCFVGRIVRDKGIEELVLAFDEITSVNRGVKLLLVGPIETESDPISYKSEQIIAKNKNIVVTGYQEDVRPFLALSNVFVFPSYREGFPNVLLQAGCFDLPCIVTNINGSNEVIMNEINGLIIEIHNIKQLQNAMLRLLNDSNLRNKLAQNSRRMIVDRYEQSYVWRELLKEYRKLEINDKPISNE